MFRFIQEEAMKIRNKCFLPLHRVLAITLFSCLGFEVRKADGVSWLKSLMTPDLVTSLLKPVVESIDFNNMLLHRANLRIHYQDFAKRYAEGADRIYAHDVVLIKIAVLAADGIDVTRVLPHRAQEFIEYCAQPIPQPID